jgi:rhodanese-related sulfurtransferase
MKHFVWVIVAAALYAAPAVGQEMTDGPKRRIEADEIDRYILEKKVFFLDVREPKELEELGTLEGYYNIPLGQLETRLGELPKDKLILTA